MTSAYDNYPDEYGASRPSDGNDYNGPNLDGYFDEMAARAEEDTAQSPKRLSLGILLWILVGVMSVLLSLIFFCPGENSTPIVTPEIPLTEAKRDTLAVQPPDEDQVIQTALKALVFVVVTNQDSSYKSGSGFFIHASGMVLTNYHVIAQQDRILTISYDQQKGYARVLAVDSTLDLAVLKVDKIPVSESCTLGNSQTVKLGNPVFVLGYPQGHILGMEPTVTGGVISSIRPSNMPEWFQMDAAVNPGNSGGPLIRRADGQVIGIVTAKLNNSEGIAFAVPINRCKPLIQKAQKSF